MEREHTGAIPEQTKETSGLAIASFVLGILGILHYFLFPSGIIANLAIDTLLLAFPSIAAIALGIISIIQIKRSNKLKGIVISTVGIAISAIILFPVLTSSIVMSQW